VPDPTLYLFDGFNVLRARGVVVFDGGGEELQVGPLAVRFAPHADELLERLAAEQRLTERVCLVSSDAEVRSVSGQEVMKRSSRSFADELGEVGADVRPQPSRLADRLDEETRARLEELRRGG
jgi:predicted RNA-binding protein with PIN domain